MERSQVISVAVGVGALGTALAYLAYSHINKNENNELIDNLVEKNVSENSRKENIKLETKKDISCWGQFWKNEYNNQNNNAEGGEAEGGEDEYCGNKNNKNNNKND
tara:strand:- start:7736 stop:8053 length:318 start_codon:yes stop_codon:yes gene_type:complete